MSRFRLSTHTVQAISVTALVVVTLACSLPFTPGPAQPTVAAPAAATESGGESGPVEVPSGVLTEVAATLFAPYQATWTAQAAEPAATVVPGLPARPTEAIKQPTQAIPTQAATNPPPASATSQPTQAATATTPATAAPQATPTMISQPTAWQPATPPSYFTTQSGKAYTVFGVNLHDCGGTYAANFLIENTGSQALESLSLQFTDLSSDQDLYGPNISDAPFTWTDRTCNPGGIDRLGVGEWLFAGGLLGAGQLSGHTILANFLFCTGEDLNGQCYPRSVEFVVP